MMVESSNADWLTMATHLPKTIRQALKRVSTIMSMVLPLTSDDSAPIPRSGCTSSTAVAKNVKMIPETTEPT